MEKLYKMETFSRESILSLLKMTIQEGPSDSSRGYSMGPAAMGEIPCGDKNFPFKIEMTCNRVV